MVSFVMLVDLLNSMFSIHTLVLVTFYFIIFIYSTYRSVAEIINVFLVLCV